MQHQPGLRPQAQRGWIAVEGGEGARRGLLSPAEIAESESGLRVV